MTFAVARKGLAIAACMRESEPPAIITLPFQPVGIVRHIEIVPPQNGLDGAIQSVRHHSDAVAEPIAKFDKIAGTRGRFRRRQRSRPSRPGSPAPGRPGGPCIHASRSGRPSIALRCRARPERQSARARRRWCRRTRSSRRSPRVGGTSHAHATRSENPLTKLPRLGPSAAQATASLAACASPANQFHSRLR